MAMAKSNCYFTLVGSMKEKGMSEISARDRALGRLNIREYSAAEMRSYLRRKGVATSEAEEVVAQLVAEGLIQDERYARVVARSQANRDKGPGYIMAKLRGKGVKMDLRRSKEIFAEVSTNDEESMIRRILERRYPNAHANRREMQRAYQGLLRRGFSQEIIRKCLLTSSRVEDDFD
jgi:SOS response regulatory protein OraA/RecX